MLYWALPVAVEGYTEHSEAGLLLELLDPLGAEGLREIEVDEQRVVLGTNSDWFDAGSPVLGMQQSWAGKSHASTSEYVRDVIISLASRCNLEGCPSVQERRRRNFQGL